MDAAFIGNPDCIRILVDGGADVNVVARSGGKHTPLTRLCQYHKTIPKSDTHPQALDTLLKAGADPDIVAGPLGLPPLAYAAMGPLPQLLDVFTKHSQQTIWTVAAQCDLAKLQTMSRCGDLCVRDDRGRTPLHYVALSGMHKLDSDNAIQCAKFLVETGIPVDHKELISEGDEIFEASALWYAVSWQANRSLVEYLLSEGAAPDPGVFSSLWSGDLEMCELLDSYGADWDFRAGGRTPLMELFHWNRPKLTDWLLDRDVDVNATDNDGQTALDYARKRKTKQTFLDALETKGAVSGSALR